MIKTKEFKIAENAEEALWERVRREAEMLIKQSEENLIIQKTKFLCNEDYSLKSFELEMTEQQKKKTKISGEIDND